jgi:hypothetical protein
VTVAFFKRQARIVAFIASVLLNLMVAPAFAACSTPAGNEGDINYVSTLHVMVYCNGTSWIGMGVSNPVSFGTLTNGDFCLATSGTAISCTTQFVNMTSQVTGTLGPTNGGTGLAAYTTGDMLYASATNTLSKLSIGTTGWVLTASPSGPAWSASVAGSVGSFSAGTTGFTPATATTGAVTLAGTLAVGNGGTGTATALTKGSVVIAGTSGVYTQDNANFFYDATNHRLGLGTATPTQGLTVFGNIDAGGTNGYLTEIANAGTTGTTVNKLAKLNTSGAAIISATADIDGMLGIVVGETAGGTSAVTTGNAQIATSGQASCVFDGQTVPGDYVSISATVAGDCLDGGASRPLTNQTIGRVLTANSGVGTAATVALGLNGSGTGGVPTGTIMAFAGTCPAGWTEYTAARGRFLRGIDNGAGIDPSGTRAAGSTQADAFQGHFHSETGTFMSPQPGGAGQSSGGGAAFGAPVIGAPTSDGTNGTPRTATETRPVNVAVTFCQYTGGSPVSTTASGTTNYVARWTSATTIGTGTMYDSGSAVGLNTASPQNLLDVNGAASIGYNVAAPTNGLIVSGNVGIGTTSPGSTLQVNGGAAIGYATNTSAPSNGLAVSGLVGIGTVVPFGNLDVREGANQRLVAAPGVDVGDTGATTLISLNDTDTGYEPMALYASQFYLGGGNVGIGTTAPSGLLNIFGSGGDRNTSLNVNTNRAGIVLQSSGGGGGNFNIWSTLTGEAPGGGALAIFDQVAATFRMVINSAGNVGIGTTSPSYLLDVSGTAHFNGVTYFNTTNANPLSGGVDGITISPAGFLNINRAGGAGSMAIGNSTQGTLVSIYYTNGGAAGVGSISISNVATAYNTSSDRRLKENIVDTSDGLDKLMQVRVRDFNFISDPKKVRIQGYIAQELYKLYPQAVTVGGDDPKKSPWSVDYGRLTPLVIKAVQQLKADNDNLRAANDNEAAQIKTLAARLDALEKARR